MTKPANLDADDHAIFERASAWAAHPALENLTRPALAEVASAEGIDFATALLYDRLLRRESVREMFEVLGSRDPSPRREVLVAMVPGAFYQEYAFTGADGQRVLDAAKRAGVRAERVPVKSFGSLRENARILRDWLAQHPEDDVCLVSLSKGGTDVQFALTEPGADLAFRNVSTWINLSGIVGGTVLANWLLSHWWRSLLIRAFAWWRGYSFDVLYEIKRDGNERLERGLAWPSHLRVFHVIGFPLRGHLQNPWAKRAHRRLEPHGPSDGGGILLADAVRWPGTIIPLWGADHYMQSESHDVAALVMRLLSIPDAGCQSVTGRFATCPTQEVMQ